MQIGEQVLEQLRSEEVIRAAPPTVTPIHGERSATSKLIDGPSINQLTKEQLGWLFADCQKYPLKNAARGPYGAIYCEIAITAWVMFFLELVPIKPPSGPID